MSSTAPASEGEKILIVDDDARLRRLLERFLDEQGYRVRTVENTEQMDRLLSRELFQLVVLGIRGISTTTTEMDSTEIILRRLPMTQPTLNYVN